MTPDEKLPNTLREVIYFNTALRCEEEGRHNLAKLYLQRAVACERNARSRGSLGRI